MKKLFSVEQDCQFFKGLAVLTLLFVLSFNLNAASNQITLTTEQISNLGVEIGSLKSVANIPVLSAPAKVVIPLDKEQIISTPQAGLVTQTHFTVGDTVKKGQVMAKIISPDLLNLQQHYLGSINERRLALANYQRDKKLFEAGVIPRKRWDETFNQFSTLDSEANNNKQLLEISGMSDAEIKQLTQTHRFNRQIAIVAPLSGIVLERMVAAGERLNTLAPLYKVANMEQLWLEIAIPQEQMERVKVGDQVAITNSNITATISLLGKSVNVINQAVMARAVINQKAATIRAGQSVNIQLIQANSKTAFEVPNAAIAQNEGKAYLFVRNPKGFAVLPVTVIGKQATTSIINGALKGTEQIAMKGAVALKANWLGLGSSE